MRLIDADVIMKEFAKFVRASNNSDFARIPTWNDAVSLVGSAPTIEPKRKGKWIPDNTNYITPHFVCSACGMSQKVETVLYKPIWGFCPRCGARMMRGEQE